MHKGIHKLMSLLMIMKFILISNVFSAYYFIILIITWLGIESISSGIAAFILAIGTELPYHLAISPQATDLSCSLGVGVWNRRPIMPEFIGSKIAALIVSSRDHMFHPMLSTFLGLIAIHVQVVILPLYYPTYV